MGRENFKQPFVKMHSRNKSPQWQWTENAFSEVVFFATMIRIVASSAGIVNSPGELIFFTVDEVNKI